MHLVEVAFKGNRKEFFHWAGEDPPAPRTPVIVEADRGEDLGLTHSNGELASKRFAGVAHGEVAGPVEKRIVRLATPEEAEQEHRLRHEDDEVARRQAMERVRDHGLAMKVSDAEWQWDRKKLILYFTAERRVDFRALVRDLAGTFRTRIELKQIGVRDEARRLDGVGRCGRQYCSASFLAELRPVNLGVAKDQGLSLNPLQISGACGRLMCCLRFEHDFYVQSRKRFPKEGRIITTARGEEKVVANDIFNDRVTLRNVEGDIRIAPLAELKAEIASFVSGSGQSVRGNGDDSGAREPETDDAAAAASGQPRHRSLPVRGATATPPSTRPSRGYRAPDGREAAHAGRVSEAAPEAEETPRIAPGDAGPVDDTLRSEQSAEQTAEHATEQPDDSGDDQRRRRRRGRRGGRRGRVARDDSRHATESGNGAPRADTDDRGE